MQQHVPGWDTILAGVCIRDADEASTAGAGVGRELSSLDVDVDSIVSAVAIISKRGPDLFGIHFRGSNVGLKAGLAIHVRQCSAQDGNRP